GVIIRHGYLAASWGDTHFILQTASLGKAMTGTVLGLAIDDGKVKLDDLVYKTWTGAGQLSHSYKALDYGLHAEITWRHMATMTGKEVHDQELYPGIPGYGSYLDPPWEIDGHVVRGGPGWVVISADSLARFGYLMLRNGRWNGSQLISEAWTRQMQLPLAKMN